MSLTTTIAYNDGAGAATNLAAGAVAYVTPGNLLTLAPQVSTGMLQWTVTVVSDYGPLNSFSYTTPGPLFQVQLPLPQTPCKLTVVSEATDGNNFYNTTNTLYVYQKVAGNMHRARGVVTAAETLATFDSVTGGTIRDGVTYVQGDLVLLVGQATKSQNGLYVVGAVSSGSAPLTRSPDFLTGTVFAKSDVQVCEVGPEGTLFANTLWKITTTGPITVDTTNHDWYPRQVTQAVTLTAGTVTVSNVPVLSSTKTNVVLVRTATGGTVSNTIMYCPTSAGANGITPGTFGTASIVVQACVAAGTIQSTDTSTLSCTILNF